MNNYWSGDHNGAIEIHWLLYTFPWRQPESTRGRVHLMWPAALCSGLVALSCGWAELWRNPPTLKVITQLSGKGIAELKRHCSGSKHVITWQLESDEGQPLSGAPCHTTNLLNFDHMTTDQLKHRKLYWQLTIIALQFTKAVSSYFIFYCGCKLAAECSALPMWCP